MVKYLREKQVGYPGRYSIIRINQKLTMFIVQELLRLTTSRSVSLTETTTIINQKTYLTFIRIT